MKTLILLFMFAFSMGIFMSSYANAGESVSGRQITSIGCHEVNGICYVSIDGAAFGANEGCANVPTNQFRWDDADQPNGKRTFAALYAAYIASKKVDVYIEGCTTQSFPAVKYFNVHD